jgi:WG containing repeat
VRQGKNRTRFKIGYIDKQGRAEIDPILDDGTGFDEGLASVRLGNQWGVVNTSGEFVIQPASPSWCTFREGLASVSVKGARNKNLEEWA